MTVWTMVGWAATAGSLVSFTSAVAWMRMRSRALKSLPGSESDVFGEDAPGLGHSFDMERYQPMERLFSSEDLHFIQQLPGYSPKMATQWRRDQQRIFRLYLNELTADFQQLHAAARGMVAQSPMASGSVVSLLIGQQVAFWRAMAGLELRLMLPGAVGSMNVRPLLQMLESMRLQVQDTSVAQRSVA